MSIQSKYAAKHLADIAEWQVKPSEKTFLQVKQKLNGYAQSMNAAILKENADYREAIDRENQRYEARLAQVRKQLLETPSMAAKLEFDATMRKCNTALSQSAAESDRILKNSEVSFKGSNLIEKIISAIVRSKDAAQLAALKESANRVRRSQSDAAAALERVRDNANRVKDAKIQLYTRQFEDAKYQENAEHHLQMENLENEHRNALSVITRTYEEEFFRYFNSSTFTTAYDLIQTTMRPAVGYTCSTKIPGVLFFGTRTFRIRNADGGFCPEVINMFRRVDHYAVKAADGQIQVSLPYFRTIEEGYSIFLEVKDVKAEISNRVLWEYTMKMLMSFPAGQARPLLLDNDSTPELTDFKAIGDSSGRNMVTKTWNTEQDIENELQKLAVELTNLTTSYGKDIASRMQREPIYMVACRNFPKGLTPDAMNAMANILAAGSFRGFFGMLQVNKDLVSSYQGLHMDTIKNACLCIKESASGFTVGEDSFVFENMSAVHQNKQEILSHLITGVTNYRRQIEKFEYLFSKDAGNVEKMDMNDINTWYRGDASSSMSVPIGISGASTVQKYSIDGVAQHGLISGVTGSGKSTLLKTMIVAAMMKYSPEDLNLYLVDFKEGVEFAAFSEYQLPWIKTIALNTQRIFALNILQELQMEFKKRATSMRNDSVKHINEARERFPRLLLVFDEVQALLSVDDEITKQCVNILSELVSEGRAMNINVIMASQNFSICRGIDALKANMVLRIAMKGSPESARIVMGNDFSVDQLEQGDSGSAAINTASGARGRTTFFQVGYLSNEEMRTLLSQLSMTWSHMPAQTRIMAIHVNQDRNSKFNRLITDGEVDFSKNPDFYELMLGDEFALHRKRQILIGREPGENMMVIGPDEETAKSIFALSMLSVLYGELSTQAKDIANELIRLVDMSDDYLANAEYLGEIAQRFGRQINRVSGRQVRALIDDTYQVLQRRKRGQADKSERLFLMIFGLDSLNILKQEMLSEDEGELSLNKKLMTLLQQGPENGINCILWARSYEGFRAVVDTVNINRYFNSRIYFGDNEDASAVLGMKYDMRELTEKSVAYRDMTRPTPNAFRVFELPRADWLEGVAQAYHNFRANQ